MPTAYNHLNTSMPPITITREIKRNTGDRGYRYKQWQGGRTSIKGKSHL